MKEKTVVLLFDELNKGGVLSLVDEVSKILLKLKYDVHIVCANTSDIVLDDYFENINRENLHFYTNKFSNHYFSQLESIVRTWFALFLLNKKLKDVVFHCFLPLPYLSTLLPPFTFNKKRIYHFCGAVDLEINSAHEYQFGDVGFLVRIRSFLMFYIQKLCLKTAYRIITISDYAREIVVNHFGIKKSKIKIIYCTVDISFFSPSKNINLRNELNIKSNTPLIVFVQRYDPRKGFFFLLDALYCLRKKGVDFHVIIAGELNYYTLKVIEYSSYLRLKYLITFISDVDRNELLKLYNSANLSIISSLDLETFGQSIIEAFSCGCPVIGTPTGAIPEVLNLVKEYKLSISELSTQMLCDKIYSYLKLNQNKKRRISNEVIEIANKYFSTNSDKVSLEYETIYSKISSI